MIRVRAKSCTETLPLSKRFFVIILFSSLLLTYIVYDHCSKNNHLTKLVHLNVFKDWKDEDTSSSNLAKSERRRHSGSFPKEHVVNGAESNLVPSSSYFTTLHKPTLISDDIQKTSSSRHEKREKSQTQEIRGKELPDIRGGLGLGVDSERNTSLTKTHQEKEHLLTFGSQVKDLEDNDIADIMEDEEDRRRLPNAIIIGVKKGGTRALLEILKIHPEIRACSKEVHFFDRDENYENGLEWYRRQMPASLAGQVTIEKSPSYFVVPGVPERVFRMSKSVKLIVIVRDPTRRAISDYAQSLERKPDNPSFEEMVVRDPKTGEVNVQSSKIEIGMYAKNLKRWLQYFPLNQFLFVNGEELIKRPAKEIKLVEKFLGLKPFISEENFYYNKTKGFPCFVGKIGDSGSVRGAHCMGSSKGRKHPAVTKEVLQLLQNYFRPYNEEFLFHGKSEFSLALSWGFLQERWNALKKLMKCSQ